MLTTAPPPSLQAPEATRRPSAGAHGAAPPSPEWPFHAVALWDAPSRLVPVLLLLGLVVNAAHGAWWRWPDLHRALNVALPCFALFHLLWPLVGPRRASVRGHLRSTGWRESLARWAPRALGPGRIALLMRLLVLGLLAGASLLPMHASESQRDLSLAALGLVLAQLVGTVWLHHRSGEAWLPALLHGRGTGRLDEGLARPSRGWALALGLLLPACWAWQAMRAALPF
ncbi:MAG: hypothetical protein EOO29_38855 [Comamonadaceae bacterium]|nr:MAG: hypothetical protein EOO29_38855 [Comamonadaceae bacterium]